MNLMNKHHLYRTYASSLLGVSLLHLFISSFSPQSRGPVLKPAPLAAVAVPPLLREQVPDELKRINTTCTGHLPCWAYFIRPSHPSPLHLVGPCSSLTLTCGSGSAAPLAADAAPLLHAVLAVACKRSPSQCLTCDKATFHASSLPPSLPHPPVKITKKERS